MTEETSDSVFILCQPESEIAEIIRKRLEQKGVPFCILPVGSHFAPPRIPDTCGVVLLPLSRELVQIPLSDTLHQLKQAGATLLPLGREDAASLWAALTAGEEEGIAQQKVYQLEDLWEKQLPVPTEEDESASILPVPPQPKVHRQAPSLDAPLVDLNLPDLPPSPPIHFKSSPTAPPPPAPPAADSDTSTLKGWLLLFLFPSLAVLALILWKFFSVEAPHEDSPAVPIVATTPPTEQPETPVTQSDETPAQSQEDQPTPPNVEKMGYTEEESFGKSAVSSIASTDSPAGKMSTPSAPSQEKQGGGLHVTYYGDHPEEEPQPSTTSSEPASASEDSGTKRTSPPASKEKEKPSNAAKPKPPTPPTGNQQAGNQGAEDRHTKPPSPAKHVCPSREDVKSREPNAINTIKANAMTCPTCKEYLNQYNRK